MPRNDETWMWDRAESLLNQAERMHRQFFQPGPPGHPGGAPTWAPPVDVFETPEEVWILIALPGVPESRVQVKLEGHDIVIIGESAAPARPENAELRRLEIPRGRFERRLRLSPGTYQLDSQKMVDGCLSLNLKKIA